MLPTALRNACGDASVLTRHHNRLREDIITLEDRLDTEPKFVPIKIQRVKEGSEMLTTVLTLAHVLVKGAQVFCSPAFKYLLNTLP